MTSGVSGGSSAPEDAREYDLSRPFRSFVETVRRVVTDPAGFFRALDVSRRASLYGALAFALVCSLLPTPLVFLLAPYDPLTSGGFQNPASLVEQLGIGGTLGVILIAVVILPILALLALYIGAGIYHLLVMLFIGSERNSFDATFKAYAYSGVAALLAWVPFLGILATLYGYYLAFVGIRETHSTTSGRAAAVIAIPFVLTMLSLVSGIIFALGGA